MIVSKHVVNYIGQGIWKDENGDLWAVGHSRDTIVSTREYDSNMTESEFLYNRKDIAFMVNYKQATITTVSQEIKDKDSKEIANSNSTETNMKEVAQEVKPKITINKK